MNSTRTWIILHTGTLPDASEPTSAHFGVAADGTITPSVSEDQVAHGVTFPGPLCDFWWNAIDDINAVSFQVMVEANTPAALASLAQLCARLCATYQIPARYGTETGGILPHESLYSPYDPPCLRDFPWGTFLTLLADPPAAPVKVTKPAPQPAPVAAAATTPDE